MILRPNVLFSILRPFFFWQRSTVVFHKSLNIFIWNHKLYSPLQGKMHSLSQRLFDQKAWTRHGTIVKEGCGDDQWSDRNENREGTREIGAGGLDDQEENQSREDGGRGEMRTSGAVFFSSASLATPKYTHCLHVDFSDVADCEQRET